MASIIIILIVFGLLILAFNRKTHKKWLVAFLVIALLLIIIMPLSNIISFKNDDGYGKRLEPIASEINTIKNYQKATQLILTNWERLQTKSKTESYQSIDAFLNSTPTLYGKQLADSILTIQNDSLKLRFTSYPLSNTITKSDTIIVFKANHVDYNMVSNDANKLYEIPPYSIYKHRILYSNKPIEISKYITKIEGNYYYRIDEHDKY